EVNLLIVAAGAHVEVERDRRLDVAREVGEDLAAALSGEVPDEAEARLEVVLEVVQLEVRGLRAVGLLVVPAPAEVKLEVLRDSEVVLDVEALGVRARELAVRRETEVADADGAEDQDRVDDVRQRDRARRGRVVLRAEGAGPDQQIGARREGPARAGDAVGRRVALADAPVVGHAEAIEDAADGRAEVARRAGRVGVYLVAVRVELDAVLERVLTPDVLEPGRGLVAVALLVGDQAEALADEVALDGAARAVDEGQDE